MKPDRREPTVLLDSLLESISPYDERDRLFWDSLELFVPWEFKNIVRAKRLGITVPELLKRDDDSLPPTSRI